MCQIFRYQEMGLHSVLNSFLLGYGRKPWLWQLENQTHQDALHVCQRGFGLVHHHLLVDVFLPLGAVQLVVGVTDQHRPAQELSESLQKGRETQFNTASHKRISVSISGLWL